MYRFVNFPLNSPTNYDVKKNQGEEMKTIKKTQEKVNKVNRMFDCQNTAYHHFAEQNYYKPLPNFMKAISLKNKVLLPVDVNFASFYPYWKITYRVKKCKKRKQKNNKRLIKWIENTEAISNGIKC